MQFGLSALSIRRPVLATVMSLVILLVGLMAGSRLGVREYPNIDEPTVSVMTDYEGASAEIIESQVTQPLEEQLSGIEGLDVMTSSSRPESSRITLRFKIDRSPEDAAADVRDRVARARGSLPDEVEEPIIRKVEADAQPVMYLALSSDRHDAVEVSEMADRLVKDRLQNLSGIAEIRIYGERAPAMRLWLEPLRLAAYGLTPQDVEDALTRQNVEVPAGRIESNEREFEILAETDLRTPAEFEQLIIKDAGGYLVRLKDVGEAEVAAREERVISRYNGRASVTVAVVKQATANPLEVSTAVREAIPAVTATLPEGVAMAVAYDSSRFIERSIGNVFDAILEAVVLVVLVIFVFLRSVRATLVPIVTIPVSLVGALVFMWILGFSINTLTLLAIVLAVGLVVDDAIVMLENIARYVEQGMNPRAAALKGSGEIAFAVIAMTITLAAVYAPIAFQTGRTGRLFIEFALTLAFSVIVSGFVALTLSPMMCGLMLRHSERHNLVYRLIERGLVRLTDGYRRLLRLALTVRPAIVLMMLLVAGSAVVLVMGLPRELAPIEDRGTIVVSGNAPEGSTIGFTDHYARELDALLGAVPVMQSWQVNIGFGDDVTRVVSFSQLKPWEARSVKQQAVTAGLQPQARDIAGVDFYVSNPPSLGQSALTKPVRFVLQSSQGFEVLEEAGRRLMQRAAANPGLINVDTDLKRNKPQLGVEIDREKAALMGIDVQTIGRAVETMLGGRQVTRFKRNGKQYDVVVQVRPEARTTPQDLSQIYVRTATVATDSSVAVPVGSMVPLSNLVTLTETVSPKELNHFNKLRSAEISAGLAAGYSLGEALRFLENAARDLPPGVTFDYEGQSREFVMAASGFYVVMALALAFIYLVLAAQFESWIDPCIIMLTVPLSVTGALLALHLTGQSMNVYSQIGLVTLIGLITKHGILIVEFANQLRDAGKSRLEAIVEASTLRLRPILMTTGAMVLGSIPLALAVGAGAESRQAIGWVIVGGLVMGTLFTLFVVPVAYTLLSSRRTEQAVPYAATPAPAE